MSRAVKLVVDCEVLGAPRSGIGVYVHEVLAHLAEPRLQLEARGGERGGPVSRWKPLLRRLPGAYTARRARLGWPPVPDDAVFFAPNFLLPPWPLVRERSVITVHDLLFFEHPAWADAARGAALRAQLPDSVRRATRVIVTTERMRMALDARFSCAEKTVCIPLGIRRFALPARSEESRPVVVIGNVEPRKDPLVAVHAHRRLPAELRRKHPLWILGGALDDGYAKALRVALDPPYSRWIDHVDETHIAYALAHAAVCVAPSRAEGYGMVPLEALGAGVAVIVSDIPVARELCGDLARRFPAGDAKALADVLEPTLRAPPHVDAAALLARHDWAAVGKAHAALFLSL